MEVVWVVVGLPVVLWAWRRFPLTRLLCSLLVMHAFVLLYGGHYTYAETPLGDWFRDTFTLSRNNYDRLGHFVQGFIPAILIREILLRRTPLRPARAHDRQLATIQPFPGGVARELDATDVSAHRRRR